MDLDGKSSGNGSVRLGCAATSSEDRESDGTLLPRSPVQDLPGRIVAGRYRRRSTAFGSAESYDRWRCCTTSTCRSGVGTPCWWESPRCWRAGGWQVGGTGRWRCPQRRQLSAGSVGPAARSGRRNAGLLASADYEHRLNQYGDPRGVFGRYPPAQPGWWPDPANRYALRYYDGTGWTGYTAVR